MATRPDIERYAFNYYLKAGLAPHQAAGIIGNLIQESSLNTGARNPGDGRDGSDSIGLGQWNGNRAKGLHSFAAATGAAPTNLDTQLGYVLHELKGPESRAGKALFAAKDVRDATAAMIGYERPAGWSPANPTAGHGWDNRIDHASRLLGMKPLSGSPPAAPLGASAPAPNTVSNETTGSTSMSSSYGGLGGLGGSPEATPQTGIRGFFSRNPAFADTLQAIGLSLMSSPNNAPLQNVGEYLPSLQRSRSATEDRALEREQQRQDRLAMTGALQMAGLSPEQAETFSGSPRAAGLAIEAKQVEAATTEQNRTKAYLQQNFPEIAGMVDAGLPVAEGFKMAADARKGPDLPASVQEYNYAKNNGFEGSFTDWKTSSSRPLVEVNSGSNSSKFSEESDKAAAARLGEIVASGNTAPQMMGDMQQLAELGTQIQTGKGAEALVALGPYAQALGLELEGLGPAQAYKAITSRLAPQMRPAGSGAASDFDARQFLESLPSIGTSPEGNEIINGTFQAISQNKIEAAELARQAQRGLITWQEAEDQITKLPNPYERFKGWKKPEGSPTAAAPSSTAAPADGWKDYGEGIKIRKRPGQ
jgi:hypothetical protein